MIITYNRYGYNETKETSIITDKNRKFVKCELGYLKHLASVAELLLVSESYKTTYIPKRSGGKRRIDIPSEKLKDYGREVNYLVQDKLHFLLPEQAVGYRKGARISTMVKELSTQYLGTSRNPVLMKMDIKDFFPNTTLDKTLRAMEIVYPFCLIEPALLRTILLPCFVYYDGEFRLPQGGPASPLISNITFVPLDLSIRNFCHDFNPHVFYCRYADDIFFERSWAFNNRGKQDFMSGIVERLAEQGYSLNPEKAKSVTLRCHNVWVLGVTVGETVSIGHERKQLLRAQLWNFLKDTSYGLAWERKEVEKLAGALSFCLEFERKYAVNLVKKYETKTDMRLKEALSVYGIGIDARVDDLPKFWVMT